MKAAILGAMLIVPLMLASCSVGRRLVPQSDITAYEIGEAEFDTRILIASRDSDFKVEVARRMGEALRDRPVYIKFIGIDGLGGEDVSGYAAIVIMTACISWGLDPATESFLDSHSGMENIIVLVTSGAGDWKPGPDGRKFDAVTSASVMENAETVAAGILERIGDLAGFSL